MKIRRPRSSATAVACLLATALAMAEATHAERESPSERRCLGEAEDCDGDGVTAAADLCRETPPRLAAVHRGCAATELSQQPDTILGPVLEDLDDALDGAAGDPTLEEFAGHIDRAKTQLGSAEKFVREGDPCRAVAALERAESRIAKAGEALNGVLHVVSVVKAISATPPTESTD